ncbi:MAG: hypothetical protein ABI528_01980, partial [bacterium]
MKAIIILLLIFIGQICYSQPSLTWNKIYDGPRHSNDGGVSICNSNNGHYFVFGYTPSGGPSKVFILKINELGDTLWTKTFTDIYDINTSISTNDGGCIFAGNALSSVLVKMDQNGNIVWIKNYLPQTVSIYDIKQTSSGYICCGYRFGFFDGYVLKIRFDGSLIWEKLYPATYIKQFFS